jgi:hypothetical protein
MWRNAGLTYLRYSQIAAEVTKKCAKSTIKVDVNKAPKLKLKVTKWEDGKPIRAE